MTPMMLRLWKAADGVIERVASLTQSGQVARDSAWTICWLILALTAALPLALVEFPPLLDFPQWVFQGHLFALLVRGGDTEVAGQLYELVWGPIPNLAAVVGIGLLSLWLGPDLAGRVFSIASVLLFAHAFAFLMRSVQRRRTAVEILGFPWALGYFLYSGFLSYLFSLPVAFYAVGKLHRLVPDDPCSLPRLRDLAMLSALICLLYLCHLFGWLVFVVAAGVYLARLMLSHRWKSMLAIGATFLPSMAMLSWYILNGRDNGGAGLYDSFLNKLTSLVSPLILFMRVDPFETTLPTFAINSFAIFALAVVVVVNIDWVSKPVFIPVVLAVAAVLMTLAVVVPFSWYGGLIRPDERFTLPAFLIALAALRYRAWTLARGASAGCVILLILAIHVGEYARASQALARAHTSSMAAIPPEAPVLLLSVHEPPIRASCAAGIADLSLGVPVFQWFGLYRLIETERLRVNTFQTSLIYPRFDSEDRPDARVAEMSPGEVSRSGSLGQALVPSFEFVQVFGCRGDVWATSQALAPHYVIVADGEGFAILRRQR
jgi:hypothetical protein